MGGFQAPIIFVFGFLIKCSLRFSVPTEKCIDMRAGRDFPGDHTCVSSAHIMWQNAAATTTNFEIPLGQGLGVIL